jgi:uncharacterized protein (DUF3084 family)
MVANCSPTPELIDDAMIVELEKSVKPIASNLFHGIGELENEINRSKNLASEIGNRNSWNPKNWFSGKKDLTAVAATQNSINKRLFDLIQEIIRVNMLSHASLIALMFEMKKGVENGFVDANGHITRLGVEGKNLAETATQVISGILDASRDTQERISHNSEDIRKINRELGVKARVDSSQDEAIASLMKHAEAKDVLDLQQGEAIANLEKIAEAKDELDSQQDEAIAWLKQQAQSKDILDSRQDEAIAHLERIAGEKDELDSRQSEAIANLERIAKAKDDLDSRQQAAIDEQKEALEKLTVQFALLNKGIKDAEAALQQHQGDTSGQIASLRGSLRTWRWITVALVLVPVVWLAVITFR